MADGSFVLNPPSKLIALPEVDQDRLPALELSHSVYGRGGQYLTSNRSSPDIEAFGELSVRA